MRVLAVDDDQSILDLVTSILSATTHHHVTTAPSVIEALEEIEEADEAFDCFLVDFQMPEDDGAVLVRLIRETPGYEYVPILMLTAMRDKSCLDRAFSAGATDYITKPVDYQELTARLQAAQKTSVDKARRHSQPLMAGEMRGMGEDVKDFRLRDPISLIGVPGAIDYDEFENYLHQLTRRRLSSASTFAVKIASVEQLYADCSSDEFRALVRGAAQNLQGALLSGRGVLSYRGNGIFLCVREKRLKERWTMRSLTHRKHETLLHEEPGGLSAHLLVGDDVRLTSVPFVHVLETLSAAIDNVETRSSAMWNPLDAPRRFLASQFVSEPEKQLERRAYDALLQSAFSDTKNKAWHRKLDRALPGEA
ncbi:response regulator [Sinisalibacter aestuarii]|uniref:Response regulatory domain-containing protein n=1 Tax=Sinisalibacter aestuarii TaxID=2949426 RepID=A0ABQ5LZ22_9RHOB|nr:response regulator [Sinisalibacter aestuarii]GKY89650.1 hypothetical protein STA1M1_35190 [Sinisalibacter aestuarii]